MGWGGDRGGGSRKLFWECCYYCFVCCTYLGLFCLVGVHGDCPAGFLSQCTPLVIMSSVPGRHFVPKYTFRGHDPSASRGPVPKVHQFVHGNDTVFFCCCCCLWLCRRCSDYTIVTCTVPKYTFCGLVPDPVGPPDNTAVVLSQTALYSDRFIKRIDLNSVVNPDSMHVLSCVCQTYHRLVTSVQFALC